MRKERTNYSREFKLKAVELSKERGSASRVAEELNVGKETIRRWIQSYKKGKFNIDGAATKIKSAEELELTRLKKELYETKLERDILKKAVGIFSKNDH
jgi:transposase